MKQTIKFIYTSEYNTTGGHYSAPRTIEFKIDGELSLGEVVEQFEFFLKAVGYYPPVDHHLEWINEAGPEEAPAE